MFCLPRIMWFPRAELPVAEPVAEPALGFPRPPALLVKMNKNQTVVHARALLNIVAPKEFEKVTKILYLLFAKICFGA